MAATFLAPLRRAPSGALTVSLIRKYTAASMPVICGNSRHANKTSHICPIVPPYLLEAIIESQSRDVDKETRDWARRSLEHREHLTSQRCDRFESLSRPRAARESSGSHPSPGSQQKPSIVPEDLLQHIAESEAVDKETKEQATKALEHAKRVIKQYQKALALEQEIQQGAAADTAVVPPEQFRIEVYDAQNDPDEDHLPGTRVQMPATDPVAKEAYDNIGLVLKFYQDKFGWTSIDDRNMRIVSSVHFGEQFQNAYWDPVRRQMVFGDGSTFLYHFTRSIDVIGHELTHAVTEYTSPLVYQGQSGALNEHISDVFGIMVKQVAENETVATADWLIGEGCLLPDVRGVALRSMKAPGTAYNDPRFGKDPQPANMAEYTPTSRDYGGVHLYSGIPNRAFYLASVGLATARFGDYSWEHAGRIWWETMKGGRVPPRCTFVQFADTTTEVAEELYGGRGAGIVRDAWNQVGVVRRH